ncbi:hypothetical protein A3D84_02195 [Candidatus Woesebacteria bacterium RIFCSPHIGHO2_02_FULL_42_20]|uniref:DUF6036 domain-containing protein n=1 Tax=Candidatus Woesebacteria bacterium RIFCSPHIGHO2_12_FULL_41_24 TaxID=1802510 RepID=A0A1F8ATB6_9BACT|nr:MAG: hypothetical protein A2W15_04475 [Candidatus Woesebacteria bacterium RBG_16_41_13]OGM28994.1 MAG: hypothetical protein A2873_01590 [Candidatus Woesebacteria bacterium RIFCSPHIGHO2_01_FULL_42_80]OGM35134.1 MAG: hypothetical protein A3D84_02195 [Candidatus Woesebacteria bacterium RIFCSPHIGHO2_02_FULL_42_20]OGM54870.1 MAG: hypothetical protein A3E44_01795 [Candidatus Woesebacteria bacterium RIFCSPHIGHO2_12_FULL_41_24]OGM66654.1 MAG: hypothetical protein A2969_03210 [Candidatus Woesebacteri
MTYYTDIITGKSWELLKKLKKSYEFILIGGWAVYLYTRVLKSKDIDVVVEYEQLERLKQEFELSKNERLKKYEARVEELQIDIYLPFYSNPGIPAEKIEEYTVLVEGFRLPAVELLAILKQKAFVERVRSTKGRKDLVDLVSLFRLPGFKWSKYKAMVEKYQLTEQAQKVSGLIDETKEINELDLNVHKFLRIKKQFGFFKVD